MAIFHNLTNPSVIRGLSGLLVLPSSFLPRSISDRIHTGHQCKTALRGFYKHNFSAIESVITFAHFRKNSNISQQPSRLDKKREGCNRHDKTKSFRNLVTLRINLNSMRTRIIIRGNKFLYKTWMIKFSNLVMCSI